MGKGTGNGWGSGKASSHWCERNWREQAGLSAGAFKKYKSLWQPDWGRQRKRSRSYIQVCMWHVALALTQHQHLGRVRPEGGRGDTDTMNTGLGVSESRGKKGIWEGEGETYITQQGSAPQSLEAILLWREGLR